VTSHAKRDVMLIYFKSQNWDFNERHTNAISALWNYSDKLTVALHWMKMDTKQQVSNVI
jgi:hypothetical protein